MRLFFCDFHGGPRAGRRGPCALPFRFAVGNPGPWLFLAQALGPAPYAPGQTIARDKYGFNPAIVFAPRAPMYTIIPAIAQPAGMEAADVATREAQI